MNKRKIRKLKIADEISKKYLKKKFVDLKDMERVTIYSFCEKLTRLQDKFRIIKR